MPHIFKSFLILKLPEINLDISDLTFEFISFKIIFALLSWVPPLPDQEKFDPPLKKSLPCLLKIFHSPPASENSKISFPPSIQGGIDTMCVDSFPEEVLSCPATKDKNRGRGKKQPLIQLSEGPAGRIPQTGHHPGTGGSRNVGPFCQQPLSHFFVVPANQGYIGQHSTGVASTKECERFRSSSRILLGERLVDSSHLSSQMEKALNDQGVEFGRYTQCCRRKSRQQDPKQCHASLLHHTTQKNVCRSPSHRHSEIHMAMWRNAT